MKKSKIIVSASVIILLIAGAFIINWKVFDFYSPVSEWVKKSVEVKASDKGEVSDVNEPADANKPAEGTDDKKAEEVAEPEKAADVNDPNEASEPSEPNEPMEALNLKNVEMKNIIQKIAQWTGKVIIPNEEAMKQKITIYSDKELPRSQALGLIYSALRAKGFIAEYTEDAIYLKPVKDARIGSVPTISADQPLAAIANKNSIVQKFFKLKNYNPVQMSKILLPLVGDYGYVSADENMGNLIVIETVENLMRFEKIITQFDVPESEQAIEKVFDVNAGDPAEIVQLLRKLLADEGKGRGRQSKAEKGKDGTAETVVIESAKTPIVLIPEPRRKWIIARASAEDMRQIEEWIEKLDKVEKVESEYETISILYVDPVEVAENLNKALQEMPGTELKKSIIVRPLPQARQIMVFGRSEMREMAKKFIAEIDVPSGQFETKIFQLKHADSDTIKENIENLYEDVNAGLPYYRRRWQATKSADSVKVISFPTMHQVTVIASPENVRKIEKQIEEWDVPLDVKKVKPIIITLRNSDAVKMAELLTKMFTEEVSTSSMPSWWWGYDDDEEKKKKIVGALYGQLTFEAVPDTKKIIVISKIPEAYTVIKELVAELDKQEMAEVPMVKVLKYGDPEEVCERLNAVFNITGTPASIRRSTHGLSEYNLEDTEDNTSRDNNQNQNANNINEYTPPWSKGRLRTDEMPVSNVIGKIRFIPDPRSKAILVLAPPEYLPEISKMVDELDRPSKQVMVKAIILEVNHENMTSLGVRLSSNQASFGDIGENAVGALTQAVFNETRGSFAVGVEINPMVLVDLLIKETEAKILNQPTLWTKDNEEAEFFKGTLVAFLTGDQTSSEGASITRTVDYRKVGVVLRVRPNITPERNVDMTIHLKVSNVLSELINNEVAIGEINTTTNLIVEDSETIMLGGILFQTDSTIESKLPLLGDAPWIGDLFHHNNVQASNKELLIFITPYVIDAETKPSTTENIEEKKEQMEEVLEELDELLNVDEQNNCNEQAD